LVLCFLFLLTLVVAAPLEPSTRAWPFVTGHHASAQSSAPSAETPGQDAPTDAAADDEPAPTAADTVHDAIADTVTGTGEWLDSFFATRHDEAENNKTRVRVSIGGSLEEGSDPALQLKFKAKIALPRISKRLNILVSGDGDDDSDVQNTANDEVRDNYTSTDNENAAVGLQYFISQTKSRSLSAVVGARFRKSKPVGVFGTRYRQTWDLDPWQLRFTQGGLWYTDNGFALPTRFDLDRPITDTVRSRTTLKGEWYESEDGYYYEVNQSFNERLDHKRGIRYQWNNHFRTSPSNRLEETNLRIRYRQAIWRDWVYVDIAPQLSFPRDRDFKPTPGIFGKLEIRFGG
jgi:hypothetical protein